MYYRLRESTSELRISARAIPYLGLGHARYKSVIISIFNEASPVVQACN
jgi:hypothetical protein